MQRQDSCAYPFTAPKSPKFSSTHSTSSAFSISANPNEDWTKISDLAERRRIQNRIAQRNYRKKIKRRLEDLERRAGSSSASPEPSHAELSSVEATRQNNGDSIKRQKSRNDRSGRTRRMSPDAPSTRYPLATEDRPTMFSHQYKRELSASPPPTFPYSYPLPDPVTHAPYPQHTAYHLRAPYQDFPGHPLYLPPLPVTLPSMSSYELGSAKNDNLFDDSDLLGQFNLGYSSMACLDGSATMQSYQDSESNTPPLLHSHSFDYSRAGSPSMLSPGTPESALEPPRLIIR